MIPQIPGIRRRRVRLGGCAARAGHQQSSLKERVGVNGGVACGFAGHGGVAARLLGTGVLHREIVDHPRFSAGSAP